MAGLPTRAACRSGLLVNLSVERKESSGRLRRRGKQEARTSICRTVLPLRSVGKSNRNGRPLCSTGSGQIEKQLPAMDETREARRGCCRRIYSPARSAIKKSVRGGRL